MKNPEEKKLLIDYNRKSLHFSFRKFISMTSISEFMIALTRVL
jgi:hypothetical protein